MPHQVVNKEHDYISVALLEGNLSSVDALKDIKDELKKRKDVSFVELSLFFFDIMLFVCITQI